jgi:hypothetical protein
VVQSFHFISFGKLLIEQEDGGGGYIKVFQVINCEILFKKQNWMNTTFEARKTSMKAAIRQLEPLSVLYSVRLTNEFVLAIKF